MANLSEVGPDYPNVTDSMEALTVNYRGAFVRFATSYSLDKDVLEKLREHQSDYVIFVMYADWCGDARRAVPVLSLLENETELEIRALYNQTKRMAELHGVKLD